MITIHIGESERKWSDTSGIDESWINQQVARRQEEGQTVCVRIFVKVDNVVNVMLATASCAGTIGDNRQITTKEQQIFELWEKARLKKADYQGGNIVAFLKQLRKIIG